MFASEKIRYTLERGAQFFHWFESFKRHMRPYEYNVSVSTIFRRFKNSIIKLVSDASNLYFDLLAKTSLLKSLKVSRISRGEGIQCRRRAFGKTVEDAEDAAWNR